MVKVKLCVNILQVVFALKNVCSSHSMVSSKPYICGVHVDAIGSDWAKLADLT
jgi:hypothetical protein